MCADLCIGIVDLKFLRFRETIALQRYVLPDGSGFRLPRGFGHYYIISRRKKIVFFRRILAPAVHLPIYTAGQGESDRIFAARGSRFAVTG